MTHKDFRFELGATVKTDMTSERGRVIGRSDYVGAEEDYLLRYIAADGRQMEGWFASSALIEDEAAAQGAPA